MIPTNERAWLVRGELDQKIKDIRAARSSVHVVADEDDVASNRDREFEDGFELRRLSVNVADDSEVLNH